ncbi:MAG: hypothetical protein ACM3SO_09915 [Betaproteobacteria bacterium]
MIVRTRLQAMLLFLLLAAGSAFAQTLQWATEPVAANGVPIAQDFASVQRWRHTSALDANGNLFIAGHGFASAACTIPDCWQQFLGKYGAADGSLQWRYSVATWSMLTGVALNASGDAFVSGQITHDGGISSHQFVARLSGATGAVMWQVEGIPGEPLTHADTLAVDIVVDAAGNPMVLGRLNGFAAVTKYSGDTGAVLWSVTPGADQASFQEPFGISLDRDGNLVGITYFGDPSRGDVPGSLIFKIDGATGGRIWATPWTWVRGEIRAFTLDGLGKPTIAGRGIAKFSHVDGTLNWQRTLSGDATPSTAYDVATASNGDILVTGTVGANSETVVTARLLSASGVTVWSAPLQGTDPAHANQIGKSVVVDANGDVLVAAQVFYPDSVDYELQTLLYRGGTGAILMSPRHAGGAAGGRAEANLELSIDGAAYTIGRFVRSDGTHLVALKYAEPPPPPSVNTLLGISTRMDVLTGDNVLIGGFVIGGSTPKTVIVRARGPSLGVAGALADPTLTLVPANGDPSIFNDDWGSASNAAQVQASGFAPGDAKESAILVTLNPGAYTAIVSGAGGTTGVAIVEVFEVDHPEVPLTAISTRGEVLTGDNVMIGGFIIPGSTPRTVVVRARGPSLTATGVAGALADPTLTLVPGNGDPSITNDDWGSAANAAQLQASGFAPGNAKESAILVTLNPGAYTAVLSGVGGTTGVAIVEVFAVQ